MEASQLCYNSTQSPAIFPAQIISDVLFEQVVHGYVERSSNHKNLKLTFAKAECRWELLKKLFHSAASYPSQLQSMDAQQNNSIPYASSIEQAKEKFGTSNIKILFWWVVRNQCYL